MEHSEPRFESAIEICREAGQLALTFFRERDMLKVSSKGDQDWVSNADREVENLIRHRLQNKWPEDGIVGEEGAQKPGSSGHVWVIDPIDGTTNFVNGLPVWCVVLACVSQGRTQVGVIHDPVHDETFSSARGYGARLNGVTIRVADGRSMRSGTVGVGYSNRIEAQSMTDIVSGVIEAGAMFHRNASGALSLAYVASGRLLGYIEEHMNAWDCIAGQLMIAEAGGRIELQEADEMIRTGGRVIAAAPNVFEQLVEIAESVWSR